MITEYNKYFITNLVSKQTDLPVENSNHKQFSSNFFPKNLVNHKDAYRLSYDFLGDKNKNITTLSLVNLDMFKDALMSSIVQDYRVSFWQALEKLFKLF